MLPYAFGKFEVGSKPTRGMGMLLFLCEFMCVCVCVCILHYPEYAKALRRADPTPKGFYEMPKKSIYKTRQWITLGHAGV